MYFYKGINGFFNINGNALTPGRYMLRVTKDKSTVSLFSTLKGTQILTWIEVTNLQKGDGSYYVDLEELLKEMKDFFTPPHKGAVPADWYQTTIGSISNEVHQNPDGTYYIFNFGKGGSAADINIGNVQTGWFDGIGAHVNSNVNISNWNKLTISFKGKKTSYIGGGAYHDVTHRLLFEIDNNPNLIVVFAEGSIAVVKIDNVSDIDNTLWTMVYDGTQVNNNDQKYSFCNILK